MSETPEQSSDTLSQSDFEKITSTVSGVFQVEEAVLINNVPTYYLKQPQETKQAFLHLLKNLDSMNLIPFLRKIDGRLVLRIIPKPVSKPTNILINWVLFFATIATTFITGYMLSEGITDPLVGGATFTVAIMIVLGMHEMGHKLTANKKGMDATPPYFIPGPPPIGDFLGIGTFGAVILQKSLPPNKDDLFDIGASGPILGFFLALVACIIGLMFSPMHSMTGNESGFLPVPLIFLVFTATFLHIPANYYVTLHPVAFAGWVGIFVTMLNLMPAAMLDGGHVARSFFGEKARAVLTAFSIISLFVISPVMAIFVLFMAMSKHPGPLDDVSSLSTNRKLIGVGLIAIFVLCSFLQYFFFYIWDILHYLFGFFCL